MAAVASAAAAAVTIQIEYHLRIGLVFNNE